jgi:hypothetical protein
VFDFAPPEAIDREGNNLSVLRALHPTLRNLAQTLVKTLSKGNIPHANLNERAQDYFRIIDQKLDTIQFAQLFIEGVRLENAGFAAARKIEEEGLPHLDVSTLETLGSLIKLHGTFILATADGIALVAAEERYLRRPKEERALRDASVTFARELQNRPDIVAPAAATFVLKSAQEMGAGRHPERSATASIGTIKNAAIVVVSGATIGALPIVGALIGGPPGIVGGGLAALIGAEGLKRSKSFLAVAGVVTKSVDLLTDSDWQELLVTKARSLEPYVRFTLRVEPLLRQLAKGRSQFDWLNGTLTWLKTYGKPALVDDFDKNRARSIERASPYKGESA